ncbi:MAG: LL-diaminopimelate aminotransferase [bacterium]
MDFSNRVKSLPPYIFIEIDKKKKAALAAGRDIINLGIGDPDKPTPKRVLEAIKKATDNPKNHCYPIGRGMKVFKTAIVAWMKKRFAVEVTEDEVMALIGAKDGITHLPLAFVNPGDIVLIPDPGYPGYMAGTIMAGGTAFIMPLTKENKFMPDLDAIPEAVYKNTKMMFLNYPNNPTSAMADLKFFEKVVKLAEKYDFLIVQDNAYSETYFDKPPVSIFQVPGAIKHAIEIFSMSKTYNMTGWRVGYAVGGEKFINGLGTIKENMDSGTVSALQEASAWVLENCDEEAGQIRELYKSRAEIFYKGLTAAGFDVLKSEGTLYLWIKIPDKYTSMEFVSRVLEEADIVITPGIGFGKNGDKYVRIALTVDEPVALKAIERLKKLKI